MRIQFNQWFIDLNGGLTTRTYRQQVDWIYHSKNEVLSPADVQSRIATLRAAGTVFHDTVPDPPPATARCLDAGGPSPHTAEPVKFVIQRTWPLPIRGGAEPGRGR
jgi:hypothetical protein